MSDCVTIPELIAKKRDGGELSENEIGMFVTGLTSGEIQECQLGAMLMAIFKNGMCAAETGWLTRSMMFSGEVLSWPETWKPLLVDKHSTGGVGDKVSLPLAPALAACGLKVPMISGRGLGFTGGTLDKLESIAGYRVTQTTAEMVDILEHVGCCIVGQTTSLVPADRIMYATRDVTATVPSLPLIASSIMSKKCAESLSSLVLDVKTGCGAMMSDEQDARELARVMVDVGKQLGLAATAVVSSMANPIGRAIGNALEIVESIECLKGNGPKGLVELVTTLGGHLLYNAGKAESAAAGCREIGRRLQDGSALSSFRAMLKAQGVDAALADALCADDSKPGLHLPSAPHTTAITALNTGHVAAVDALACGRVSFLLGAGRTKAGAPVDHAVGLQLHVDVGSFLNEGEPWVTVHHQGALAEEHIKTLQTALRLQQEPVPDSNTSLIIDVIQ